MKTRAFSPVVVASLAILAIGLCIAVRLVAKGRVDSPISSEISDMTGLESTQIAVMTAVTAFSVFSVGASLGSFLNVVVYRVPLGLSLVRKRSSCPSCDQPIEMRDNIPIFGWIKLWGRCRNCGWSIPIRYPLVELAVAVQFVTLFFVELISGGKNLPVREPDYYAGVVWTVWYLKYPDLMQLYLFHCLLLYLSLAMMLIAVDQQIVPRRLIAFGILVGLAWLVIEPQLHPVLGLARSDVPQGWSQRVAAIRSGILGITFGTGVGIILGMTRSYTEDAPAQSAICAIFSLCGLYLSPSVVLSVAAISLLLHLLGRAIAFVFPGFKSVNLLVCSVLALHIQILFWRQLSGIPNWPCHAQAWNYHLQILLLVVMTVVAIRDWDQQLSPSRSPF